MATADITPIRPFDEEAALAWLRAQPGGRTKLSDAELGRRWGWNRKRVGRRIKAWAKEGRVTRRGDVTTATPETGTQVDPVPGFVPGFVPPQGPLQHLDDAQEPASRPSRSLAVLNAARDAASLAAPDSRYVARLVSLNVQAPAAGVHPLPQRHGRGIDVAAYTAAVALAGAAAFFSIKGMVVLFPGTPSAVVAMALAMEGAKLITAGWLARRWRATAWVWRGALIAFVAGLAVINAAGVYAQLVAAHVGERGAAQSAVEMQDAALAAKIERQIHSVADLDRRIGQIDTTIEEAARRGRTNTALSAIEGQRRARGALVDERNREAGTLAALKAERATVAARGHQIEADAAPIRYAAELLGIDTDSEKAIRWLIALMVLCADPLAISLTAAASARRG